MRRRVLIELLQLQERHHQPAIAVHRDRQRSHHRFGFEQRHRIARLHFLLEPPERIGFFAEREVERGERQRRRFDVGKALEADGAEAHAERPHLPVVARVERRFGEARGHFFEKGVELIAADAVLELQPLNARADQPLRPIPRLQVAQRLLAVDDLVLEEREGAPAIGRNEPIDLDERGVDGPLARRMTFGIQRHRRQRVREGVEESDRVAHDGCDCEACRTSASGDWTARPSTAVARG
jgi:hypothetical protein